MLDPSLSRASAGMRTCMQLVRRVAARRDGDGELHTVSVTAGLPSLAADSSNGDEAGGLPGSEPPGGGREKG